MKIRKFALMAASAAVLLSGCGAGSPAEQAVKAVSKASALIVAANGQTFSAARTNDLKYGTILNFALNWVETVDDKNVDGGKRDIQVDIAWVADGDGKDLWTFKPDMASDSNHTLAQGKYPQSGDPVNVKFVATLTAEAASMTVTFSFNMLPKA